MKTTEAQKAKCVLLMNEFGSPTLVQRKFKAHYKTIKAPDVRSIKKWFVEFQERGHMKGDTRGRKPLADITVDAIKGHFEENPRSSIRQGSQALDVSYSSVQKTLRKILHFYPYKMKLVHKIKPEDGPARVRFSDTMILNLQ